MGETGNFHLHLALTFRCLYERLDLLDEVLDRVGGSLQLLLVAVQGVAEVGRVLEQGGFTK